MEELLSRIQPWITHDSFPIRSLASSVRWCAECIATGSIERAKRWVPHIERARDCNELTNVTLPRELLELADEVVVRISKSEEATTCLDAA